MSTLFDASEEHISKLPALHLLCALGYSYLTPGEALSLREGRQDTVILAPVLRQWLSQHVFTHGGQEYTLSPVNVDAIMRELAPAMHKGLRKANEELYEKMVYGVTVPEVVGGKRVHVTVPLLDWTHVAGNVLHVTEEYAVSNTAGTGKRIPDIVCFVNGLPLAVVECKRPARVKPGQAAYEEGISQTLRNHKDAEIPQLFAFSQLLLAVDGMDGQYATCETPKTFWNVWREQELAPETLHALVNSPPKATIFAERTADVRHDYCQRIAQSRSVTGQDTLIAGVLHPERLLDIIRFYTIFDQKNGRIVARYPQYFGIKAMLQRLAEPAPTPHAPRKGGVIWHTTGSGKSYSMIMLSQALVLTSALARCRVVVVTDRLDLEAQISRNFIKSGVLTDKEKAAAVMPSGAALSKALRKGERRILFTIINKFATAYKSSKESNTSRDIIVLVDEGHRSNSGETHALMRQMLPHAAFIAFTGTPLLKDDKTRDTFGPIIHAYTMQQAVQDKAVTPLLYEERVPDLEIHERALDAGFERITKGLSEKQCAALKRHFARSEEIYKTLGRIELIAKDISQHFATLPKGLKGQLACDSRPSAIAYKRCLDAIGTISSAVVMSHPDTREGHDSVDSPTTDLVQQWWAENVGNTAEKSYTQSVISAFATDGPPDLLIVVDKLLTGFDEPRNAALYIDKSIDNHDLLQATARVNRLHEKKKFGLLIDYRGILARLDTTMRKYDELAKDTGYDAADLEGLYANMSTEYKRLPQLHDALLGIFAGCNLADMQALRLFLAPNLQPESSNPQHLVDTHIKRRDDFYAALRNFAQCLAVALQSQSFYADKSFTDADRDTYKRTLRQMSELRQLARSDAAESVEYGDYVDDIRALVEKHLTGVRIEEPDKVYFVESLGKGEPQTWPTEKTRSETAAIKGRVKRTIETDLADDPYAREFFSKLLNSALEKAKSLFDAPVKEYLLWADLEQKVRARDVDGMPATLPPKSRSRVWFGLLKQQEGLINLEGDSPQSQLARLALDMEKVIAAAEQHFSINLEEQEKEIRRELLPSLFGSLGLELAQQITESVIHSLRVRRSAC